MDREQLLGKLNKEQQRAVSAPRGNILVLAGAGSGKTRILVHRIAWLLSQENVDTHNILAVTFTNKGRQRDAQAHQRLAARTDG